MRFLEGKAVLVTGAGPAQKVVDEIRAAGGQAAASTDSVAEWESANRIIQFLIPLEESTL